jgi:RNA-directed DNA polymerase
MPKALSPAELHDLLLRASVDYFCRNVFGEQYSALKGILYPAPPYRTFLLAKRSGSYRVIQEPRQRLKDLQLKALAYIDAKAGPPKPCVHGFLPARSIVTNARHHLNGNPYHLLNLDLQDFFPSINFYRARGVFRKQPFLLGHDVATVLAQMCTFRNELPQGAPTSPAISNLVCRSLDRDLIALARRHRSTYTRYADDLTFSFSVRESSRLPENLCSLDSGVATLGRELKSIVEEQHHFRVNEKKTRISTRHSRMEVTGVKINEFPNVRREFLDRIRGALHAWEIYGYANAQAAWLDRIDKTRKEPLGKRVWSRQTRTGSSPELKRVLWGRLLYVRMVRGRDDALYTRLAERFNALIAKEKSSDPKFESPRLPVELIVRNAADAEKAVYVIEWLGDYSPPGSTVSEVVSSQGTAFAYKSSTRLLTCDHVLTWRGEVGGVDVTVDCLDPSVKLHSMTVSNPTTGVSFAVTVEARDSARDLASLKPVGVSPVQRHFSGMEAKLNRNEAGVLIGFPNWTPGRVANRLAATVLSRFPRSALDRLEISAPIRQGNSGGPFVDSLYRVAGVAQQGSTQQAGNDECLCVSEMDQWLATLP